MIKQMTMLATAKPLNIDQYISGFPEPVCEMLHQMRTIIGKAAPGAEEVISYGMPAFRTDGALVYFAAFRNHIGFYPTSSGIRSFTDDLKPYKTSKGAVQFPFDRPLPKALITKIVKFRVKENKEKVMMKKAAQKPKSRNKRKSA
jgi:uncharacterized protein YdhG (YjbR/CyaY superfamily)